MLIFMVGTMVLYALSGEWRDFGYYVVIGLGKAKGNALAAASAADAEEQQQQPQQQKKKSQGNQSEEARPPAQQSACAVLLGVLYGLRKALQRCEASSLHEPPRSLSGPVCRRSSGELVSCE